MTADEIDTVLESHYRWLQGEPDGQRANLRHANLAEANLADANLAGANLHEANLYEANLAKANLAEANLRNAYLAGANLYGANLRNATLRDADLADANLSCALGIVWAQAGPVGQGRRTLTGIWQPWHDDQPTLIIHGGCAHWTPGQYRAELDSGRLLWDWTAADEESGRCAIWRSEIRRAVDLIETSIGEQLTYIANLKEAQT